MKDVSTKYLAVSLTLMQTLDTWQLFAILNRIRNMICETHR